MGMAHGHFTRNPEWQKIDKSRPRGSESEATWHAFLIHLCVYVFSKDLFIRLEKNDVYVCSLREFILPCMCADAQGSQRMLGPLELE